MFPFLPQLFPGQFTQLLTIEEEKMEKLADLLENEPGLAAFKEVFSSGGIHHLLVKVSLAIGKKRNICLVTFIFCSHIAYQSH